MATYHDVISPTRRTASFLDRDVVETFVKEEDAVTTYSIDWSADLDSGVTVSSVATDTDGVTLSGGSLATPIYTFTISKTNGEVRLTATLSDSDKLYKRFRFISPAGRLNKDYPV